MSEHPPENPMRIRDVLDGEFLHRHPATKQTLRYFEFSHLPEGLRDISRRCAEIAVDMIRSLPDGPQLTLGLQKLIEAKDCFVRANLPEE